MNVSGAGRTRWPAALLALTALAGCGTRVGAADIAAGAGGGEVHFSAQTLAQLRTDAASVDAQAAPVPMGRRSVQAAPARAASTTAAIPAGGHRAAAAGAASVAPTTAPKAPAGPTCSTSAGPIAVGQIGTFSGVAGPITAAARTMLAAWAKDINARGGLACHPVEVYSEDDGGDPARAASEVQQLVAAHHVVAFVASLVPLSIGGFRPALEAAKVPEIGGAAGTEDWNESPWIFPDGASVEDLAVGLFRNGVDRGHRRVGLLYCVEATACTDLDKRAKAGMVKEAGAELAYDAPVSVAQPDYTAQCLNARDAKVDLLTLALDGASITRVVRSCAAVGYRPLIGTGGGLLTPSAAADPTLRAFGAVTVSAEAPWTLSDTPGLREYHRALARWLPDQPADGASVMAWASAKLFEAAVAHLPGAAGSAPLTAASLLTGLGAIHTDSLGGLTGPLTFSPGEPRAISSGCIFFELLGPSGWTAPQGSRPVCVRH